MYVGMNHAHVLVSKAVDDVGGIWAASDPENATNR